MTRPTSPILDADLIARASRHATATLHEADGRRGALPAAIAPVHPSFRLCGPAFTAVFEGGDNLWIHRAVAAAAPGDVLVLAPAEEPAGASFGYWGEVLGEAAAARGLAGVVVDGGVRDGKELSELGLPVFARGLCIRGTGKRDDVRGALGVPVGVGDVVITPGDLVVGDADGVVTIPAERAGVVIESAAQRVDKEARMIRMLREGATTVDLLGLPA